MATIEWDGAPAAPKAASAPTIQWDDEKPAPAAQKSGRSAAPYDVEPGIASAMNVANGLIFGFGDEIAGALGADKERYRATLDQFRKDYPGSAMLGTVSAGLLPAGLVGKAAQAGVRGVQFLRGASPIAAAAATGGAGAALTAAGDSESMGEMPNDAARAAAAGMALGPMAIGATKGVGGVMGALRAQIAPRLPGGAGVSAAEALARQRVALAFERDKLGADGAIGRMLELGPESRVVDAGGENVRGMLDINATLPGQTKDAVEKAIRARIAGRPDRLDPLVDSVSGGQGRAGRVFEDWQRQKEMAAGPLYARLNSMSVPATSELSGLLSAMEKVGALKEGQKIAAANGGRLAVLTAPRNPMQPALLRPGTQLPMGELDTLKRGLDGLIAKEQTANGNPELLRALLGLKNRYLTTLDGLTTNPQTGASAYKQARDAFSGPAAMQDALQKGRKFLSLDGESLGVTMDGLSGAERDAFRIGAAEALRSKFGSQVGQTEFLNAWKNRNVREKLGALFGDEAKLKDALKLLSSEETLKRLESIGRGSQTASRLQGAEDQSLGTARDMVGAMGHAGASSILPGLGAALKRFSGQAGTPEPVRDAIGRILLGGGTPAEMAAIGQAQEKIKMRRLSELLGSGSAAGAAGAGVVATPRR